MGVEEERIRSPREGLGTHIEVIVFGREGDVAIVLSLEVFHMLSVFGLNLLHPEITSPNFWGISSNYVFGKGKTSLTCGKTSEEADLSPEIGSA